MHRRPIYKMVLWSFCLLWLGLSIPNATMANENATHLHVIYQQTKLFIEAQNVPLPDVLKEIGNSVGFTVTILDDMYPTVNISFKDATLEYILKQLLYEKNYLIISRPQTNGSLEQKIDRLFLLGTATSVSETDMPEVKWLPVTKIQQHIQSAKEDISPFPSDDIPYAEWLPSIRVDRQANNRDSRMERAASTEVQVKDLLRNQALTVLNRQISASTTTAAKEKQHKDNQSAVLPSDMRHLEKALATTTRIAHQNLQTLIKGLNNAGSSLLEFEHR